MAIRIEVESERVTIEKKARVIVYDEDTIVAEVIGEVVYQTGADGGRYPCVSLTVKK